MQHVYIKRFLLENIVFENWLKYIFFIDILNLVNILFRNLNCIEKPSCDYRVKLRNAYAACVLLNVR